MYLRSPRRRREQIVVRKHTWKCIIVPKIASPEARKKCSKRMYYSTIQRCLIMPIMPIIARSLSNIISKKRKSNDKIFVRRRWTNICKNAWENVHKDTVVYLKSPRRRREQIVCTTLLQSAGRVYHVSTERTHARSPISWWCGQKNKNGESPA